MSALLALALAQLAGGPVPNPAGPIYSSPSLMGTSAWFEAFPRSGRGTFGPCSTTAPTGAKGEALTFTRSSNGTCTKTAAGGLATTGIANGDLVVLSNNQPRVEYDSQGVLGLLVESSRTNSDLRSEEIDNAWWSNVATGAANPTLNGTCANSPLASPTSTPEDYTFPATTAGQQSGRLGTVIAGLAAVAGTHSFYVCGVDGAGSMDICVWNTTTPTCSTCDFPACSSNTWNRCTRTATSSGNVATFIGNNTLYNGGTSRSSNRVCVTGAQAEAGSYATSYIPTTSAAVTRSAETATFPGASLPANPYSLAVSFYPPTATTQGDLFYGNAGSTSGVGFFFVASLLRTQNCSSGCATFSPAYAPTALTTTRLATSSTGGQQQTFVNGSSLSGPTATAAAAAPWATATGIGPGIGQPDAIISRICVDPDASRCR